LGLLSSRTVRFGLIILVVSLSIFVSVHNGQAQAPFALSVYPIRIILGTRSGFADRFTVTVLAGEAFNDTVYLSVAGVPDNVTAIFGDRVFYLTPRAVSATYLEITSSPNATFGNYTLTVGAQSQGSSIFYAAAALVTVTIQENGQPQAPMESNRTQSASSIACGQEYVISLVVLAIAGGIAIGSALTYFLVRRKTQPAKAQ